MAGQKFTLTFDANLNVSQMKGALGQIQSTLNGLHLPQNVTKGLQGTFDKLQKEIQAFEVAASKDITSKTDFKKLETQAAKVTDAFEKLKIQVRDLAKLNAKDLEKLFPQKITQNIQDATNAIKQYQANMANATKEVNKAQTAVNKLTAEATKIQGKQVLTGDQYKQLTDNLKVAQQEVNDLDNKLKQLNIQEEQMRGSLSQPNKSSRYRQLVQDIKDVNDQLTIARQNTEKLANQKANSTTFEKQAKDLADLNAKLVEATNKLNQYKQDLANIQSTSQGGGLKSLLDDIGRLTGMDMSKFSQDTKGAADAIQAYLNQELQKLNNNLHTVENTVDGASKPFEDLSHNVRDSGDALEQFNTQAKEIDQLKSRIQYFFGLNNAINLVKRTMREAYNTIKELDKAMTETAVVTDFSVGDMWAQLPDYTKRANELGVSTKAAYEAATLYYQQGLKTNEVMAMSNETLKMARIAGLDAAVATDRMTNAIRGFNMEINTTNAQRIDDVYSRLAAISASNVDEISTAMTKVASLAHSANMEFETTAAFLAQIIETTRESAETAGTALKTVVARFSEVKKLVSEGELRGSDEEGELIDVNKVSSALRTAGIDLNRYFLGEVGLDDIFMELASKWDSLTTMQQRYIATQAAGSRQQSRFIALMSDYARTQELVGEAYNANGAAAKQFAKTQESLESKLARLKNAWNEFAMGILNSDLVKAGVDLLTNILNGINALTSGFGLLDKGVGGVINSISKLILLFGSLGAGKTLLSGLTASISNIGLAAAGKAPLDIAKAMSTAAVGANATGTLANLAGRGKGGALLAGFLNPFAGIGNIAKAGAGKAWGAAKNLGTFATGTGTIMGSGFGKWGIGAGLSGSAGMTAGLTGIATAFVGISVAILGAVAAYKTWEKFTPSGQLHAARKYAEEMQKVADEAKESSQSIQQLKNTYEQYSQAVEQASTLEERRNAIQERNNAILEAIDKNPDYARFLDTDFDVTGELVLTLDADKVTEAAIEAAKEATKASINSYFADADVYFKQAQNLQPEVENYKQTGTYLDDLSSTDGLLSQIGINLATPIQESIEDSYSTTITEFNKLSEGARKLAQLGYASMIQLSDKQLGEKLGADIEQSLAETLSRVFQYTGEQIDQTTLEALEEKLISGDLDTNILSAAVADGLSISLANINLDDTDSLVHIFNFGVEEVEAFATAIGEEPKVIYDVLRARAKEIQAFQKQQRTNIFESMLKNNAQALDNATIEFINSLNSDELKTALDLLTSSGNLLGGQGSEGQQALHGGLQGLLESGEAKSLINLFNSINLDNPIRAFQKLTEVEKTANETVKQYIGYIKQANSEAFSRSGRIQSFFQTEDYEKLSESVAKFREENGKISAKNIEDLSNECGDLKTLLDDTEISANQLAEAINAINDGAPMEGLTDAVLDAFDATADLDDLILDLHDSIQNFNAGIDYGEGTDFIVNLAGQLKELAENFELGNQQTENIYDYIFGDGAYQRFLKNNPGKNIEELANLLVGQANAAVEMASEESYGFMNWAADKGILGISRLPGSENGDNFLWDIKDKTSEELRDAVKEAFSKETGQEVSDEFAWSLVEGAMAHMKDLRQELETNDYNAAIEEFVKKTGEGSTATQAELQTLATAYNKTIEEVSGSVQELGVKIPTIIKLTDEFGNPLDTNAIVDQLEDQKEKIFQAAASEKDSKIVYDYDILVKGLLDTGMSQAQADEVINTWIGELEGAALGKTVKFQDIDIDAETGNITATQVEANVTADSVQGLEAAAKAKIEEGVNSAEYELAAQKLADIDLTDFEDKFVTVAEKFVEIIQNGIDSIEFSPKTENSNTSKNTNSGTESTIVSVDADTTKYESTVQQASNKNRVVPVDANTSEFEKQLTQALETSSSKGTTVLTGDLNGISPSQLQQNVMSAVTNGGYAGANNIRMSLDGQHFTIYIDYVETNRPSTPGTSSGAAGGYVQSLAGGSGNRFLQPGFALTGEEAPEIVWNKELGYAYITGSNGPEFRMLQPGDRVFNAQETSRILRNSSFANGGYFGSYATGGWNRTKISERRGSGGRSGGSGGSGGSGEKEPSKEEWRSDFDWLYNLMEDITELQREQNKLQEEQNKILELGNDSDTGKDLYENLTKQMANLLTQKTYQSTVSGYRRREMQEFMAANAGYGEYFRFNDQDQTLEINWDAINEIGDKETYEKVKDLVSEAESIQKKMDDSEDAVRDIETQIRQLEDIWRDSYVSFEKRVLDALIKSYQRVIDNYSDLNDTVTRTNNDILNAIQKEISLERQIRDNTSAEESISDAETRLAFLRRDTTGGNQVEILNAQKELDEERRQYEDTLIDQAITRLQDDNEVAAGQRDKQIELMQTQLDYAAETGAFNDQVYNLIAGALGADGELLTNSDLFELLQQEESWAAMSATNKQVWEDELNNTFKEVSAYLLKEQGEIDGSYLQAVAAQVNDGVWASANIVGSSLEVGLSNMGQSIGWAIGSMSQAFNHIVYSYDNAVNALGNANAYSQYDYSPEPEPEHHEYGLQYWGSGYTVTQDGQRIVTDHQGGSYNEVLQDLKKLRGYKTGGLNTKTGLAWLDGTPSEPEYVLNARQTDAFLKLADVLPSMFNGVSTTTNNVGGTMYLNFDISVDSISNDYDVDQLVERVKNDIYNAANYRNANVINFSR